ncbi:MAG TPA: TetR/AcrR family transcriptional regulator C-terminal domain-containing protein [Candidatus Dormibacteraeota bacterium]|nr:TetR/AcrR family transcriptional regulator C-terminal domain-containing protein [Candidatus Dormibacteraeota bacterium]
MAEIRRRIQTGELGSGARVPSTRAIVDDWGVAMATATRVLTELRREGLVRAIPGVGTVVEGNRRTNHAGPSTRRPAAQAGALTTVRIVAAGIEIADAEGLDALSMRRVATEIGVATMSLYRHLADKDDLVLQMMNTIFAGWSGPADPPAGWRPRLEIVARALWKSCREHPWLASALSITRPQALSGALPFAEFALSALDGIGLDHPASLTTYLTLVNYVRGTAVNLEQEAEAEALTGVDSAEWLSAQESRLRALAKSAKFPVFTRYVSQEFDFNIDELFEFGLGRLLDGLTVLLANSQPTIRSGVVRSQPQIDTRHQ